MHIIQAYAMFSAAKRLVHWRRLAFSSSRKDDNLCVQKANASLMQSPAKAERNSGRSAALRCFPPVIDRRSQILILGTMPGPEALRRREYYGFRENDGPTYPEKLALLRENRIALWDTIACCRRIGSSDGAMQQIAPNRVPQLIRRYPNIRVIFLNGETAWRLYQKYFAPCFDAISHEASEVEVDSKV